MKKVVSGVLCDTDTARLIGAYENSNRGDFHFYREELYRTKSGRYFLYGEGYAASPYARQVAPREWAPGESIKLMSPEAAKQWAEENLSGDDYIAAFGEPEEEDRQQISIAIAPVTRERLEALKKLKKMPFGEIVDRAIAKAAEEAGLS